MLVREYTELLETIDRPRVPETPGELHPAVEQACREQVQRYFAGDRAGAETIAAFIIFDKIGRFQPGTFGLNSLGVHHLDCMCAQRACGLGHKCTTGGN